MQLVHNIYYEKLAFDGDQLIASNSGCCILR